jgi:small subunit ribosomal protein S2
MRPFLYGTRLGHVVFDLDRTSQLLASALNFIAHVAAKDGVVLFATRHLPTVSYVEDFAKSVGEYSHCRPWKKGLFTNATRQFGTVTRSDELMLKSYTVDHAILMMRTV